MKTTTTNLKSLFSKIDRVLAEVDAQRDAERRAVLAKYDAVMAEIARQQSAEARV